MNKINGFELEIVENVEVLDAGDNAMNFTIGFLAGIGIVIALT